MTTKSPTMRDVARVAGVSIQTVSCVINQTGNISPETRDRVWEVVNTLQYKPNPMARSMRTRQTRLIALLVMEITNPVLSTIASAVEAAAYRENYNILLYNVGSDVRREQAYLDMVADRLADGVIIVNAIDRMRTLQLLGNYPPAVLVDCVTSPDVPFVSVDNFQGGYLATQHLIELGHCEIAHIGGAAELEIAQQRAFGYTKALQVAGLSYSQVVFSPTQRWDFQDGYLAMRELLALKERPTAVFAASDQLAFGAYRALAEHGLRVPHDISIVGFDNIELAAFTTPPLTTINQPLDEMGRRAFALLLDLLDGKANQPQVLLPPELVVRESTRKR